MESIKQAIDLARSSDQSARQASAQDAGRSGLVDPAQTEAHIRQVRLDGDHLERSRIVAHGVSGPHGRYYDMLRTQVLQEMDKKNWQFLAVTSPTAACGKTVTSCNLAMSISRLPGRSVLLVDADMHKPMIGQYLGLTPGPGLLSVLEERVPLSTAIVQSVIGPNNVMVLPGEPASATASEWMASATMGGVLQAIKRDFRSRTVIFDLPPMLLADDVISILPRMDAVLLVAGVGTTTTADIKECQKHLQRTPVVRVVVNKVTEAMDSYRAYY